MRKYKNSKNGVIIRTVLTVTVPIKPRGHEIGGEKSSSSDMVGFGSNAFTISNNLAIEALHLADEKARQVCSLRCHPIFYKVASSYNYLFWRITFLLKMLY